jgi:uncharacterized protein (TIGR02453 family)
MMSSFTGFPKEAVRFLADLRENNHKAWFDAHREIYEDALLEPAQALVVDMGLRLREFAPQIVADPRVNQSIFRINRDVRFSSDKSPYKTHMAVIWWEGSLKKLESPSFYFHLEPDMVMLGVGIYEFSKPLLEVYRQTVAYPKHGKALAKVMGDVRQQGYTIGSQRLKKIPRGYDAGYERVELLLYTGMHAGLQIPLPPELHSAALLDILTDHYRRMYPLYEWLVGMMESAGG